MTHISLVNVVLLYGCAKSFMPNPVECLLQAMVEVLLVLEIFLKEDSRVDDLVCGASSCSEACLFFSYDPLRSRLRSVQFDLQHGFACVAGDDRPVVLALLHVASLGKCDEGKRRSFTFTYPLTAGIVWALQMISQPDSSIFLFSIAL